MKKVSFVIAPIFITIFAVGAVFSAYYFPYARKAKQHDNDFLTIKRSYQDFRTNSISTVGQIITGFNSSLEQSKTMVIALRPYENAKNRKAFNKLNTLFDSDSRQIEEN